MTVADCDEVAENDWSNFDYWDRGIPEWNQLPNRENEDYGSILGGNAAWLDDGSWTAWDGDFRMSGEVVISAGYIWGESLINEDTYSEMSEGPSISSATYPVRPLIRIPIGILTRENGNGTQESPWQFNVT